MTSKHEGAVCVDCGHERKFYNAEADACEHTTGLTKTQFDVFCGCACRFPEILPSAAASAPLPAEPAQFVSDVDQWKRDLTEAGWTEESATAWYSPDGGLYRGPHGAWKELQRRITAATPAQPEGEEEQVND